MVFPSLIVVACANAQTSDKTSQNTIVNSSNGITEFTVHVDFGIGTYEGESTYDFTVRKGVYYKYFKNSLPDDGDITYDKVNFKFEYYSLKNETTEVDPDYRFNEDGVELVAQYTQLGEEHTVTWENYDGTVLDEETYHKGEMPTYKGLTPEHDPVAGKTYTFDGWEPEIQKVGDTDQTYVAQYEEKITDCVVSFNTNGGNYIPPISVVYNGTIAKEKKPTAKKDGYKDATDWYYKDAEGKEQLFVFANTTGTKVTNDMILYCKWETLNQYNAVFKPNGGTWDTTVGDKTVKTYFGEIPTLDEEISFEGHTFAGWKRTSDGGIGLLPMTEKGETYTAQWDIDKYTVAFDTKGGTSVAPQEVKHGETIPTTPTTTYEGHTITDGKWYYEPESGVKTEFIFGDDAKARDATPVTSDITVYCEWTIDKYDITFDADGGTWPSGAAEVKTIENVEYGTMADPGEIPTKTGHTFTGWDKVLKPVTKEEKYTATWDVNKYTVTFDTAGGSFVKPEVVNYNETIAKAPETTYKGHTITDGKWFYKPDGVKEEEFIFGDDTQGRDATPVISNITVYCKWTTNKYDITFKANGGTWSKTVGDELKVSVEYGKIPEPDETLTPPEGKIFTGWTPKIKVVEGDATYEAVFGDKPATTVTVTFKSTRDGSEYYNFLVENVLPGSTAIRPYDEPTEDWEGHDFIEWRKEDKKTPFSFKESIYVDTVVYAHFKEAKTFDVVFFDENGEALGEKVTQSVGHLLKAPALRYTIIETGGIKQRLGPVGWIDMDTGKEVTIVTDTLKQCQMIKGNVDFDFELDCRDPESGHQFSVDYGKTYINTTIGFSNLIHYEFDLDKGFPETIEIKTIDYAGKEGFLDPIKFQYYNKETGVINIPTNDGNLNDIKSISIVVHENQ